LRENLRLLMRGRWPLLACLCMNAAAIAGFVYVPWLLLLVLPVFSYLGYAAYRDVFRPA
jgi:hypothetical protein